MYLTIHTNFVDHIEEFTTLPILQFLFFDLLYMSYQLKIKKNTGRYYHSDKVHSVLTYTWLFFKLYYCIYIALLSNGHETTSIKVRLELLVAWILQ
jgi:hypothetical protein